MLPGSNESGVLLSPKVSVPPFFVEGFTTLVTPALKAALLPDDALPPLEAPVELVPLLLEHAATVSPVTTAHATNASLLRLLICGTSPFTIIGYGISGSAPTRIKRVTQSVAE